ncbi:isopentenyl-diphosphate Delta-isomerase [Brevibacterium sp. 5221]|uniref:Isopentenyl-diphosphate Delta-isomerase n=1 Tax=Brevibacterium rongguiense TaxID=2695267 RepID=A0A6N9H5N8_9MICO|nr:MULTISPECIES: isopentenyl-diphosphate Delta-isomerase [Brevibacterium]MYM19380.1 isopentenyl-diphosphate Delta-isomerase [Brevibacterium rongguiense]WAL39323.1 isopentenyl-diphosphate Delta-isomerase [Brevibacterium sp. BRM-1]
MDETPDAPEDATELVVLLDDAGAPVGTAPKATVHGADTPLHLAFSCFIHDGAGRVLLTRRALAKRTWPGVWTNSVCGHPGPGEDFAAAIVRRCADELGCLVTEITEVLPDFRYRAIDASGTVENEVCPVFTARLDGDVRARAEEVMDFAWLEPAALTRALEAAPFAFSPWLVLEWAQLAAGE